MIDRLRELISLESYSGKERPVLEHIKVELEKVGIQPFFQGDNLVAKLVGEDQSRAFIFNGHVDVVDIGDPKKWQHDPWGGEVVNGRVYGRGTSDMKGGVLAIMEAARSLVGRGVPPTDVWLAFVVREETDGAGTEQFTKWFQLEGYTKQYRELAAVFAEPTNLNTVQYGHRGNFFIRAEKEGDSGHSSRPLAITPHAILEMSHFIADLEVENVRWQKEFQDSEFVPPTITPTSIEAKSESPNKTAANCQANFDLRTIPGYHDEAFDRVEQLADRRGIKLSLLYPSTPTGYTSPDARIVKVFQEVVQGIKTGVNDAANDLGFFTKVGINGVIFGPGEMSQAHRTNESADVGQITAAPGIFEAAYLTWAQDAKVVV